MIPKVNIETILLQNKYSKSAKQANLALKNKVNEKDLKQATDMFEEYFISSLMKQMRKTPSPDTLLSGGHGEGIFRDLLDNKYASLMAEKGGIGISKFMYEQLKRKKD